MFAKLTALMRIWSKARPKNAENVLNYRFQISLKMFLKPDERNGAVAAAGPDPNSDHILFGNKAFHKLVGVLFLQVARKSAIAHVSIQR